MIESERLWNKEVYTDVHRYVIWYIWVIWVTKIQCLTMPHNAPGFQSSRFCLRFCQWAIRLDTWCTTCGHPGLCLEGSWKQNDIQQVFVWLFDQENAFFGLRNEKKLWTFGGQLTIWDCHLHGFAPGSGTIGWHDLRISSKSNESYELHKLLGQHTSQNKLVLRCA